MRSQDRTARIAVATLYIRLRDARRNAARDTRVSGIESVRAQASLTRQYEIHNTLQIVRTAVLAGVPSHGSAYSFMSNVRRAAAVRAAMRERELIAA